uniref:Capsid protein n=1 Tax=uncultured marine virus TaxID=186617 RepID=S4TF97_9VIRU|nr:hypothetical protein [uncultured marine virus]
MFMPPMSSKRKRDFWASTHSVGRSRTGGIKLTRKPRGKKRNARVVVPRNKLGFPTSMVATLRYTERLEFEPTGTDTTTWSFRANSCFDPLANVGGHQARGFDEYSELYNTYTVTSSKISTNFMYEGYNGPSKTAGSPSYTAQSIEAVDGEAVPALPPAICGIFKSNAIYGSAIPVQEQMEKDRTSWTIINPQSATRTMSASSALSEFFGKQDLVAATGYSGLTGGVGVGSDPDNQVYYHVFVARGADDYPTGECKIVGFVTMEFRVTFTDPKALAES